MSLFYPALAIVRAPIPRNMEFKILVKGFIALFKTLSVSLKHCP